MPYLTCRDGNTHSTYEQSIHVKQAIEYRYYDELPSYVNLIRCDKPLNNYIKLEEENYSSPLLYIPLIGFGLFFICLVSILCIHVFFKNKNNHY